MRIVGRDEFVKLPEGTVYAKYAPRFTREFSIKGESISDSDWFYQDLDPIENLKEGDSSAGSDQLIDLMEDDSGFSTPLWFEVQGRDGCFDEDQLFVVFDDSDTRALIERLGRSLATKASNPLG